MEDSEDEGNILAVDDLHLRSTASKGDRGTGDCRPDEILECVVDAGDWNLEVESILPQLKVTLVPNNKV